MTAGDKLLDYAYYKADPQSITSVFAVIRQLSATEILNAIGYRCAHDLAKEYSENVTDDYEKATNGPNI